MIDFAKYDLNTKHLKLVRLDFNFKSKDAIDVMYDSLTREEKVNIEYITKKFPNLSNKNEEQNYWDIFLVDFELLFYLENLLVKYGVNYSVKEITNQYYKKSKILNKNLIEEIDNYLDKFLDIDIVLDRINSVGIDKINKFELSYLEKQSKK